MSEQKIGTVVTGLTLLQTVIYATELGLTYVTRNSREDWPDLLLNVLLVAFVIVFAITVYLMAVMKKRQQAIPMPAKIIQGILIILMVAFLPLSTWIYDQSSVYNG